MCEKTLFLCVCVCNHSIQTNKSHTHTLEKIRWQMATTFEAKERWNGKVVIESELRENVWMTTVKMIG